MRPGGKIGRLSLEEGSRYLELMLIRRAPKKSGSHRPPPELIPFRIKLPKGGRNALLKNTAANKCVLMVTQNAKRKKNVGRLEIGASNINSVQVRKLLCQIIYNKIYKYNNTS